MLPSPITATEEGGVDMAPESKPPAGRRNGGMAQRLQGPPGEIIRGPTSALAAVLEALAEEGPETELRVCVDALSAAGALDERAAQLALDLRQRLEDRRRLESELGALVQTAEEVSGRHDLGDTLDAICRRARGLVRADVAYITLDDPQHGDVFMSAADGIVTAAFHDIRLAYGAGLGGLVAQAGQPRWTSGYLVDEQFAHLREVDQAVLEEGLVAIAGVPLLVGTSVAGVLIAGNRDARRFRPADVALLETLAAHAAVAIDAARQFAHLRQTIVDLEQALLMANKRRAVMERSAALHERLTSRALAGATTDELVVSVADTLGSEVLLVDDVLRLLHRTSSTAGTPGDFWSHEAMLDLADAVVRHAAEGGRAVVWDPGAGAAPRLIAPVRAGHEILGYLVAVVPDPGPDQRRLLERAALVIGASLAGARAGAAAEQRILGELLAEVVIAPPERHPDLARRADLLRVDLDRTSVLVLVRHTEESYWTSVSIRRFARDEGGIAAATGSEQVLLIPGKDPALVAAGLHAAIGTRGHRTTAVVSEPVRGVAAVADAHGRAHAILRVLAALGREGVVVTMGDVGPLALLFGDADPARLRRYVRDTLAPVAAYDTARNADLLRTMEAVFAHEGNLARAAAALPVHVNTLYQRLERIGEILGPDWRQGDRRLELHLAVRLQRLDEQLARLARGEGEVD
jgi:DNA-binding PucR family transcriptional regulator